MSSKTTHTACLYRRHGFYASQMALSCIVNKQSFRTQYPTQNYKAPPMVTFSLLDYFAQKMSKSITINMKFYVCIRSNMVWAFNINPLKTKRRLLYSKTQSVLRS